MSFKNRSPIATSILLEEDGIKLEMCQAQPEIIKHFAEWEFCLITEGKLTNYWATYFLLYCKKKTGKGLHYFIIPAWFIYWKCMICQLHLPHCCLSRRVLIQHQVKCLQKLNCFGFICWSCQFLALLYPTQCCLYLYHWCLLLELPSSLKYNFFLNWEVLESKE